MITNDTPECCTATLISNFSSDLYFIENQNRRQLISIINRNKNKQKILYAFLTNKQRKTIKLLKEFGFKRAGREQTRPDRHNTFLYLYYLILKD